MAKHRPGQQYVLRRVAGQPVSLPREYAIGAEEFNGLDYWKRFEKPGGIVELFDDVQLFLDLTSASEIVIRVLPDDQ